MQGLKKGRWKLGWNHIGKLRGWYFFERVLTVWGEQRTDGSVSERSRLGSVNREGVSIVWDLKVLNEMVTDMVC